MQMPTSAPFRASGARAVERKISLCGVVVARVGPFLSAVTRNNAFYLPAYAASGSGFLWETNGAGCQGGFCCVCVVGVVIENNGIAAFVAV